MGDMHMSGIGLIAAERARQIDEEGWTPEHDRQHTGGELAQAAAYYCCRSNDLARLNEHIWPPEWHSSWAKREGLHLPTERDLVKAGALIAAELDRRLTLAEQARG